MLRGRCIDLLLTGSDTLRQDYNFEKLRLSMSDMICLTMSEMACSGGMEKLFTMSSSSRIGLPFTVFEAV